MLFDQNTPVKLNPRRGERKKRLSYQINLHPSKVSEEEDALIKEVLETLKEEPNLTARGITAYEFIAQKKVRLIKHLQRTTVML